MAGTKLLILAVTAAAAFIFASRRDSRLQETRQHKEDLATWEGEGGAPAA